MPVRARYDAFSDWYADWVEGAGADSVARVRRMTIDLLGRGSGTCLDIACGTGAHARTLRALGWAPIGFDVSLGQLGHAVRRMPVAAADASALPVASNSVPAAICLMCHTDVGDYASVLRDAVRVLRPGGRFVHVGVHPCFVGAFADRSDVSRVVVDEGYHRTEHQFRAWSPHGVRARVGATHLPLAALLQAALDAGLRPVRVAEAGPVPGLPDVFGLAAVKPAGQR